MSMEKKIQQAYQNGVKDACDFWDQVIRETKGIGPKMQQRIKDKADEIAKKKVGLS